LSLALVLSAWALVGAVAVWQWGRLHEQRAFLTHKQAKYREHAEDTAKQAQVMQLAMVAKVEALKATQENQAREFASDLVEVDTRIKRLEQGRSLVERKSA